MFRKNYFSFFAAAAFILSASLFAFAQSAPVRGRVLLKKADGSTEPVAGATIEPYRTDIKGKLSPTKTDKKGNFSYAGFILGQTFAFAVSAPNIQPTVFPNVRAGMDDVTITVYAGDGKRLTEEEARQSLVAPASTAPASTAPAAAGSQGEASAKPASESAETKKAREERERKAIEEVNEGNKKIENAQAVINSSLAEGFKAMGAKNYDLAIAKYDEGYKASPTFVGSAPVLLNNKATALVERAIALYNQNTQVADTNQKVANKIKIKQDFSDAVDAYNTSWLLIKNNTSTEVSAQNIAATKMQTLNGAQSAIASMVATDGIDSAKSDLAGALAQEYIGAESDQAKKLKAQTLLGDLYRVAGDYDKAIAAYRKSLDASPNDANALGYLGLCLFTLGSSAEPNDKAMLQEGLNYMQKFVDTAPQTHPLKESVKDIIDGLKARQLTPQKIDKKPAPKKKP